VQKDVPYAVLVQSVSHQFRSFFLFRLLLKPISERVFEQSFGKFCGVVAMAFSYHTLTRTVPYWVTVLAATWIVIISYVWNTDKGYTQFQAKVVDPVSTVMG
jgi:hypothetical protein